MKPFKSALTRLALWLALVAVPATVLACPSVLFTSDGGQKYCCYLAGQDANYCYYDCYPRDNSY